MKRTLSYLRAVDAKYFWYGGLAFVVLAGGWFFLRAPSGGFASIVLELKPFVQQVSVSGKVVAAQKVDLGFSQGGRVAAVYVRVGQQVGAGSVLAEVENSDLRATVLEKEAAVEREQATLASLQAGTRAEEVAVAQATVDNDKAALVDSIADAYRAAEAAVRITVDQFIDNPRNNPSLKFATSDSSLKSIVEQKRATAEGMLMSWAADVGALSALSDLASAHAQAQRNLTAVSSLLSDAAAALSRAITSANVTQTDLDGYISDVSAARTSVNSATSALTADYSSLQSSQRTLALKQAPATPQDLSAQESQVKVAQAALQNARAQLQKTLIIAPFGGTVTVVDAKVGKIVSPNTPEMAMISTGAFQIESFVPEINIALLAVGDRAEVMLDAYGSAAFAARVVAIDPAETVRDGVSTYRATLQFDTADPRIKTGMTANVAITTDTKASALAVPQGLVVYRDGKAFVRTLVGEQVVEKEVTLGGVSSLGEVEVLSGLSAGDRVVSTLP